MDTPSPHLPGLPPYFILYRRVSTGKQAAKDISLPAQRREQMEAVTRLRGQVLGDFEDGGISGKTDKREQFQMALLLARAPSTAALLKQGHAVYFLVWKSNRAFRNRYLAVTTKHELRQIGVRMLSVTEAFIGGDTLGDKMMEGIQELVDEMKTEEVRIDTQRSLRQLRDPRDPVTNQPTGQGRQGGKSPFGYRLAPKGSAKGWQVCPEEAALVQKMFASYRDGHSFATLTRELNGLGLSTITALRGYEARTSGYWSPKTVRSILKNPVYTGRVRHWNTTAQEWGLYPGAHPAIVDDDLFDTVQRRMRGRSRGRAAEAAGMFNKLLRCPHCDFVLHGRFSQADGVTGVRGGSLLHRRYQCSGYLQQEARRRQSEPLSESSACPGYMISENIVKRLFLKLLENLDAERARGEKTFESVKRRQRPAPPPVHSPDYAQAELPLLERQFTENEDGRKQILHQHFRKWLTDDEAEAYLAQITERQAALRVQIDRLQQSVPAPRLVLSTLQSQTLRSTLADASLTPTQKRDQIADVFAYLRPSADKQGMDGTLHRPGGQFGVTSLSKRGSGRREPGA